MKIIIEIEKHWFSKNVRFTQKKRDSSSSGERKGNREKNFSEKSITLHKVSQWKKKSPRCCALIWKICENFIKTMIYSENNFPIKFYYPINWHFVSIKFFSHDFSFKMLMKWNYSLKITFFSSCRKVKWQQLIKNKIKCEKWRSIQ